MVDLTKKKDPGAAMMGCLTIVTIIAILLAVNWLMGWRHETAKTVPPATSRKVIARPAPTNETWTRIAWYWKYDPKKSDYALTKVTDQFGCAWWVEIGNHLTTVRPIISYSSYRHRAYDAKGLPECPKSEMPEPNVAYLTNEELKEADIQAMTIVSRTTVKAGDPGLVAYYRERRDEAARETANDY